MLNNMLLRKVPWENAGDLMRFIRRTRTKQKRRPAINTMVREKGQNAPKIEKKRRQVIGQVLEAAGKLW